MRHAVPVAALALSLMLALIAMPVGAQPPGAESHVAQSPGAQPPGAQSPGAQSGVPAPSDAQPSVPPIDEVTVLIVQLRGVAGAAPTPQQQAAAVATIAARLAAAPGLGTRLTPIAGDRIRLDLADPSQGEVITRVVTAPGEFRLVAVPSALADQVTTGAPLPEGMSTHGVVGPGHVIRAAVAQDQMGNPAIDLQLDTEAAKALDDWAAAHQGEMLALVLDDLVMSVATINARQFDGRIQVSGSLDLPQAQELVAILAGGPLPVAAWVLTLCPAPDPCLIPSPDPRASAAP